jgi:RNA polymerase sigma-70 factor (ECF subfamily)
MSSKTDGEIALEVQKGDVDAFGILIERYESKLARYAKRFLFNSDDSKDLLQEIFIKAYMNIKSFDATREFSPWIYRIAHNEFINAMRKRNSFPVFPFDLDIFLPHLISKETADKEYNEQELKEVLGRSLEKIKVKYREVLVLYYFEEMDYQKISEILKIPVSTVGVRLSRGKAMLKKIINEQDFKK